jgi:hypothetical protein
MSGKFSIVRLAIKAGIKTHKGKKISSMINKGVKKRFAGIESSVNRKYLNKIIF